MKIPHKKRNSLGMFWITVLPLLVIAGVCKSHAGQPDYQREQEARYQSRGVR